REYDEPAYADYVTRHRENFFATRRAVRKNREKYGHRNGQFTLYNRFLMLDDFGPQGVIYAEAAADVFPALRRETTQEYQLVDAIAHQIQHAVPRLPDGTLARITPDSFTVQSDDLFMANLFNLRAGLALGRKELLDDAIHQAGRFAHYLTDAETGLYRHAYFTKTGEQASTIWGRGMGWTMLIDAMLLHKLGDRKDPRLAAIRRSFRSRCEALLRHQSGDGRWHQVITDPSTYKETSCTAMFTFALATGHRIGILPEEKFAAAAKKGYDGLCSQIDAEGNVTGIVRGTPIFPTPKDYADHRPRRNDPRGVGAIIWAALAVDRL
ncbi:MAG: glycoside hydrolase family 88 protein, partial [Bacteroidota bacterium]